MIRRREMAKDFNQDGILVGWYGTSFNAEGKKVKVFIPRRDEDIEADITTFLNS